MKRGVILSVCIGLFCSFGHAPARGKVILDIRGIRQAQGKVYIAAFRKHDPFPSMEGTYRNLVVNARTHSTEAILEIPHNTYSIAVFHDANNNGKMDKNFFGVPTELYGFSNNARATFSAPAFEDAAFELKDEKKLVIYLK